MNNTVKENTVVNQGHVTDITIKKQKLLEDIVELLPHVTYEHLHGVYACLKTLA